MAVTSKGVLEQSPTHHPRLVRLPNLPPTFDFQGGQPALAVAERVDALEVAQVQNLPVLLRRVADDGDLASKVPLGDRG